MAEIIRLLKEVLIELEKQIQAQPIENLSNASDEKQKLTHKLENQNLKIAEQQLEILKLLTSNMNQKKLN